MWPFTLLQSPCERFEICASHLAQLGGGGRGLWLNHFPLERRLRSRGLGSLHTLSTLLPCSHSITSSIKLSCRMGRPPEDKRDGDLTAFRRASPLVRPSRNITGAQRIYRALTQSTPHPMTVMNNLPALDNCSSAKTCHGAKHMFAGS